MHNGLTADDVRKALDPTPNATCGYVRLTYVAKDEIAQGGLPAPFAAKRPMGSGLYFMVTPVARRGRAHRHGRRHTQLPDAATVAKAAPGLSTRSAPRPAMALATGDASHN